MYEVDETGWLWTKGTPDGEWVKASAERTISALWDRVKFLQKCFDEKREDRHAQSDQDYRIYS